jgi:hypothetical protein
MVLTRKRGDNAPGFAVSVELSGVLRGGMSGEEGENQREWSGRGCGGRRTSTAGSSGSAGEEESEVFSMNSFQVTGTDV